MAFLVGSLPGAFPECEVSKNRIPAVLSPVSRAS